MSNLVTIIATLKFLNKIGQTANNRTGRAVDRLQLSLLADAANSIRDRLPKRARKLKLKPDELTKEEQEYAKVWGGKIPAIKLIRERTGLGLKEAKDLVEAWMLKNIGTAYVTNPDQNYKPFGSPM